MAKKTEKKTITTSKKQKFVGFKTYIDKETGEEIPMQIRALEDRDFNFHKIWFEHFVSGIDEIVNQKARLAFWIIRNLNKENQLVMTQRQIAEETGISYDTVNRTMKALCKPDEDTGICFLQKMHGGAYRVNPDVIYKGSHDNRMGIVYDYNNTAVSNNVDIRTEKQRINDKMREVGSATVVFPNQTSMLESVNDEQRTHRESQPNQFGRISAVGG
jgi:DNA-binding transcriptional regulator YhcF (GntR family)